MADDDGKYGKRGATAALIAVSGIGGGLCLGLGLGSLLDDLPAGIGIGLALGAGAGGVLGALVHGGDLNL